MDLQSSENQKYLSVFVQLGSIWVFGSLFFGFLIVNLYLALFGFWDFNFLRVQYVSAGALFLFCIGFTAILSYGFFRAKEILVKNRLKNPTVSKTTFVIILIVFVFSLLFSVNVISFILLLSLGNVEISTSFLYFISVLWVSTIWIVVNTIINAQKEIKEVRTKEINLPNTALYFSAHSKLFVPLIVFPIIMLIFSFVAYPAIPRYFGGGKPTVVDIGLRQSFDLAQIEASNPLKALLVYQSSDSVLIVTISGTFLLKQDDISYIKYLEKNKKLNNLTNFADTNQATSNYNLQ